MSQRVKRPNRSDDGSVPTKRRKRPTTEEEEAATLAAWHPRPLNDFKSIYNRSTTEAPAELFRKDLISAMKLPDSEPLASHEYWVIVDQWKQEWERGVQVPVNPDSLPEPSVTVTHCANTLKLQSEFKLPKNKYIRITKDDRFKPEEHALSSAPSQAEAACSYDLDECDVAWLKLVNEERILSGCSLLTEDHLEKVLEKLELRCWEKIQSILRNEEGLGIEYDENVICDVCRSPDSEEGNEMVFCDSCNICVHQACYGITRIPEGQWLCCTCALSQRPECVLCPNKGGAMKCTRSGKHWAHVSCALWIPEVSIGCVEKMEPITKVSSIPQSRWALICVLCRERVGACIQCSVKTCKTAYHVTCAFKHGLEMRAIIEDENADDGVKLRSYCEKHSKSSKKEKSVCSGSEDDDLKKRRRKDMTSEEKNQARAARLQEIESEFFKHVSVKDIVHLDIDSEALQYIYNYWKLKRKAGNNKPLLPPKSEDIDMLSHKQEQADIEKMKMFVQLRQDLERVRNLCYMVSRREKLSRSFFRMREQTFHKQAAVLSSSFQSLPVPVIQAVIEANHGPSIYDRLYSHSEAEDHTLDFDMVLARIAGMKSPQYDINDKKKSEYNGVFKDVKNNPYKKLYFNGSSKRRSGSLYGSSMSSASSSDEMPKDNKENRLQSSAEEEKHFIEKKKFGSIRNRSIGSKAAERRHKRLSITKTRVESSSEEDVKQPSKDWGSLPKSRLKQMENELGISGSDSDELMPIHDSKLSDSQKVKAISSIYSDSDSTDTHNDDKSSNAASDSQQNKLRTKAAVKEFSQKPTTSKSPNKSSSENKKKTKEGIGKKDYVPSELIVPQRQAAKKASENMKSTTTTRVKEQPLLIEQDNKSINEEKLKIKPKLKLTKDVKETKECKKEIKTDIFDIDKEIDKGESQEILAYVPQRQAAKKASEHIKSLGKPGLSDVSNDIDKNKNVEICKGKKELDIKKKEQEVVKSIDSKQKSSSNSSMSSLSSSSTESTTSNTSESEDDSLNTQSESLFSSLPREHTKRPSTKDRPFLVKDAKSPATSSSPDTTDTSCSSTPSKQFIPTKFKADSPTKQECTRVSSKPIRKIRHKSSFEREESIRIRKKGKCRGRQRSSNSGDRIRNVNVRAGDISDSQRSSLEGVGFKTRKGKPDDVEEQPKKESNKSTKLLSPIGKTDKKLNDKADLELGKLEKEILERKADRDGASNKMRSTLDRLFGSTDKKEKVDIAETCIMTDRLKSSDKKASIEKVVLLETSCKSPERVEKLCEKSLIEKVSILPDKSFKVDEKINETLELSDNVIKLENKLTDKLLKSSNGNKESTHIDSTNIPIKKSPSKTKSIVDIFANKLLTSNVNVENVHSDKNVSNYTNDEPELSKSGGENVESQKLETLNDKKTHGKLISQNRSIFSPQPNEKESDLLDEFDNILNEGFSISKEEEILKGSMSFSFISVPLFKEDSKEDNARETLNLVEKLRMELSKKSTGYDIDDSVSVASSTKNENDKIDFTEQIVPNNIETKHKDELNAEKQAQINLEMRIGVNDLKQFHQEKNEEFRYLTCENSLTNNTNISSNEHVDQNLSTHDEPDPRWILSNDNYPNMQAVDPKSFSGRNITQVTEPYIENFDNNHVTHNLDNVQVRDNCLLASQLNTTTLTQQIDVNLEDQVHKNHSPNIQDRIITETPFLDPASMDCIPSPSSYADIHPQAKWADSQVMPNRRSSSSSNASTSSTTSRRNDVADDELMKRPEMIMMNHNLDIPYNVVPQMLPTYSSNPIESFPPFSEASQFVSPVSLFPPPINNQLSFPSPGTALFPPSLGASYPTPHPVINPLPKPIEDSMHFPSSCTAAFTSSQHNLALTAAMVNPPQVTRESGQSDLNTHVQTPTETSTLSVSQELSTSPDLTNSVSNTNHVEPSADCSFKSNSTVGKKSPSKPIRSSARFLTQQSKSPSKSPGKSPRQESTSKPLGIGRVRGESKRGTGKSSNIGRVGQVQSRGRGRGRGRGRTAHTQHTEYDYSNTNTIHNKLVGTVYDLDFDDDISSESMCDLRAMRERRKSVDMHDRKLETQHISRDSQSPKFSSPSQTSQKRSYNADLRDLKPPSPIAEEQEKKDTHHTQLSSCDVSQNFKDIVPPLLPGPVDMRTYNTSFGSQTYKDTHLLREFSTDTVEHQGHEDIDDDFEKELQTALTTDYKKPEQPSIQECNISNIKVSLSDSRNQLKVKIKGPIANYTSTVPTLPQTTTDTVSNITSNSVSISSISSSTVTMNPATSNLRRMRKKELLRQYCSEDMNMDDPSATAGLSVIPTVPSISRTIITIPKAVASMTSIPTKDDYRDYRTSADDILDTKLRKESKSRLGGIARDLRNFDILDDDASSERRRSIGSTSSNTSASFSAAFDSLQSNKRRGRPPRQLQTPKLKIRISGNSIVGGKIDDKKDTIRPPKKRLSTLARPTVEDLKRESMKFRKQVMADFDVEKRKKKEKSNKKKKKKKQQVQIISNESINPTKLIIRFSKKVNNESDIKRTSIGDRICSASVSVPMRSKNVVNDVVIHSPLDNTNSEHLASVKTLRMVRTNKAIPIKLKLSRCQEGSGYVMKTNAIGSSSPEDNDHRTSPRVSSPLNVPESVHPTTSLPLNKDCEVR